MTDLKKEIEEIINSCVSTKYQDGIRADEILSLFTKEKEKWVEDVCKIIEKIELEQKDTSFDEWRMYKHIRNTLRDKYLLKPKR